MQTPQFRLLDEALDIIEMLYHPRDPARKARRERWIRAARGLRYQRENGHSALGALRKLVEAHDEKSMLTEEEWATARAVLRREGPFED